MTTKKNAAKYAVAVDRQCGHRLTNGSSCTIAKTKGNETCRWHNPLVLRRKSAATGDKPLDNLDDCIVLMADCVNGIKSKTMEPREATAIGFLADKFIKAYGMKQKLDPAGIALRTFSAESARELVKRMTMAQMRAVLATRNKGAPKELIANEPVLDDDETESSRISQPGTPAYPSESQATGPVLER